MSEISREHLLAHLLDLIRAMPDRSEWGRASTEALEWAGHAAAAMAAWDSVASIPFATHIDSCHSPNPLVRQQAVNTVTRMLHYAANDLRLKTTGPTSVAVGAGAVFDYFDELRKLIGTATDDLLFVDPYLDADFVSNYLPHARADVAIRLLTGRRRLSTLIPAVELWVQQNSRRLEVRRADDFHDRYLLVDGRACYQSGASFKDGGKNAPTTLTQIVDAFPAMRDTYERMWSGAAIVFPTMDA